MVGHSPQRPELAQVDHQGDLTGSVQKVHSLLRVSAVTVWGMPRRHVAIAVLVALTWGVNFVVLHVGLESFPPLLFTGLRFLLVALLIPFVPRPGVGVRWVIVVGLFMSAGHHGLVTLGLHEGMPAGLASLVLQLQAAFTIGFAVLLIGEQPRRAQLVGGAVALGGIAIIATGRSAAVPLGAVLLMIGAACSWGLGNVAARKAASPNPLGLLVWSSLVPPLPLFGLSAIFERGEVVTLGRVRRARPAVRRRPVDARRVRRVGVAAAPALGLDGRAVLAARPGVRDRVGVAVPERGAERDRAAGRRRRVGGAFPYGGVDNAAAQARG